MSDAGPQFVDRREWTASLVKTYTDTLFHERDKLHTARVEHLEDLIDAVKDQAALALQAARDATAKSEVSIEKRFDAVNEFRAQLADERGALMRQDVADRTFGALEQRLQAAEAFQQRLAGALVLAALFVPFITGVAVYLLTRHAITVSR